MSASAASLAKPRHARIACRKCHSRKVKCSGGLPCSNCKQLSDVSECCYPSRTRRIKVEQRYIDDLLGEIERLRNEQPHASSGNAHEHPSRGPESGQASVRSQDAPSKRAASRNEMYTPSRPVLDDRNPDVALSSPLNPLLTDRPWFLTSNSQMPLLIGEATDVAFATRLRQAMLGPSQDHFPRTQFVDDAAISSIWKLDQPWPDLSRARFLLKVVSSTLCRRYYIMQKSATKTLLEQALRDTAGCDTMSTCKLFAIFALGEIYSTRTYASSSAFPGIGYFVAASRALQILSEQPRIECIETMLMLSIYCLTMNRRHSAYCIVGYAVRFAVIMGLHLDVPQEQLPNAELQEHRRRIWWTAYILDRSWASMLGKPISIRNEDIDVALPAVVTTTNGAPEGDFAEPDYLTASLQIADLSASISASIYNRKIQGGAFATRVQNAISDLGEWLQRLPEHIQVLLDDPPADAVLPAIALYIYFNQCFISTTRPILLHYLRMHRRSPNAAGLSNDNAEETAAAVSKACIDRARRSYSTLVDAWINGLDPTFDASWTRCLFSTSTILAMSGMLRSPEPTSDADDFETAAGILSQLDQNGNFAAKEYMQHVNAIRAMLQQIKSSEAVDQGQNGDSNGLSGAFSTFSSTDEVLEEMPNPPDFAMEEATLQDLLTHPDWDFSFLENNINDEFTFA